jgi:tRNA-specific 2-thiouridylase
VGQRRGLGVAAGKPQYVVALDPTRNAVVLGDDADLHHQELACRVAWFDPAAAAEPSRLSAQIRSRHPAEPLGDLSLDGAGARVTFRDAQRAIAPGQTIAFFDGDVVVGSGVIESAGSSPRAR